MLEPCSSPLRIVTLTALVLVGCSPDSTGKGITTANLGDGPSGMEGGSLDDDGMSSTADEPTSGVGTGSGDSTPADSTGDVSDTTGPSGCMVDGDCPPGMQCQAPDCIAPGEGDMCVAGMCPAGLFCAPDGLCHDGSNGDPCAPGQCTAPWFCSSAGVCQDGSEGDPCMGATDCSPMAPICSNDKLCHDGTEGDSCGDVANCAPGLKCGPSGSCQDGNEGDPCDSDAHCGPSAPYCPYDHQCHNGNTGDPCNDNGQYTTVTGCFGLVCGL